MRGVGPTGRAGRFPNDAGAMSGLPWTVAIVLAVWLLAGLVLEAVLAWRQWRHLARVEPGREPAATHRRRIRYGQRRALFQWLASAEAVLRVGVWLGGGLSLLTRAVTPEGWLSGVVFVALFAAVDQLLGQPLRWGRWWAVERAFGTSRLDAAGMARDGLASGGLAVLLATLAAAWTLWPFGLLPAAVAWPLCGLLAIAAALAYFWARPNLIAPLFNRFTSLPAGALRQRLAAMMDRSGAHLSDVRIMDGSRRSTLANAYFAGVGRSKRIVLLDTLMEQLANKGNRNYYYIDSIEAAWNSGREEEGGNTGHCFSIMPDEASSGDGRVVKADEAGGRKERGSSLQSPHPPAA